VAKRLLASLSSWTIAVARTGLGSLVLVGWVATRGDLGLLTSMDSSQLGSVHRRAARGICRDLVRRTAAGRRWT
jgi:hypothetical protein